MTEKEAAAPIQDLAAIGISRDQIVTSAETKDATQQPLSPLKIHQIQGDEKMLWQQCGSLVSRVYHMESLLQTLKLAILRLETEGGLDSSQKANLKQQLATQQQDSEEDHRALRRDVMKLRDQLYQAYQDRDGARTEVQSLCETVEAATAAKMDVAFASEELKAVKLEMREKLMEMKERMSQESTSSAEALKSHSVLLQQVKEMEGVVEMERKQSLRLQSDCQVLLVDVQKNRQQLEEEKYRGRQLEEHCQQLKEQIAIKDFCISELKTELKADRNLVLQQLHKQDLLLTTVRRNIHTELQEALTDNFFLQKELEKLKGENAQLLQSSCVAQETLDTQRELLEQISERLQQELNTAQKKEELCFIVTKLEGERSSMETQLIQAKREAESLSSALQSQQDENRRLMGKMDTLEQQQMLRDLGENKPAYEKLKSGLQHNSQTLHQELGGLDQELASLKGDRLQAQREIRKHQNEVEKLQRLLTYSHWKNNRALKMTVKDSSTRSGDQAKTNQELEQRVSELERLLSKHDACIRGHRNQLKQLQRNRSLQENFEKAEREEDEKEQMDRNIQEIRMNPKQVLSKWETEMERWTSTIQRWETKRTGSHH
ncbi:coiled-coil domain-containing protein 150 isoform X2 [Anabas testudineus]|uniref:coiled-coil domain-containing protein 150 isoform X2 n=1 Tax=Anabas testudineus TaxID=64144 RepID=UPI000E45902F|nr:coiled-coil domain-containing protein 150 isoform X2 [Anabas testudineus]